MVLILCLRVLIIRGDVVLKDTDGVWELVDDIAEDEGLRSVYVDLGDDGSRPHWLIRLINYLQPFFVFVVLLFVFWLLLGNLK